MTNATFRAEAIQFVRPHGKQVKGAFKLPTRCLGAFTSMQAAKLRLEAEILPTNEAYVSISDEDRDHTLIVEPNDGELPDRIADMLIKWQEGHLKKG